MNFDLSVLGGTALTLVVAGLIVAYGLQIMGEAQDDMTANSTEASATGDFITGIAKIPAKVGTIVSVLLAGIIIYFVVRAFRA